MHTNETLIRIGSEHEAFSLESGERTEIHQVADTFACRFHVIDQLSFVLGRQRLYSFQLNDDFAAYDKVGLVLFF